MDMRGGSHQNIIQHHWQGGKQKDGSECFVKTTVASSLSSWETSQSLQCKQEQHDHAYTR